MKIPSPKIQSKNQWENALKKRDFLIKSKCLYFLNKKFKFSEPTYRKLAEPQHLYRVWWSKTNSYNYVEFHSKQVSIPLWHAFSGIYIHLSSQRQSEAPRPRARRPTSSTTSYRSRPSVARAPGASSASLPRFGRLAETSYFFQLEMEPEQDDPWRISRARKAPIYLVNY